MVRKNYILIALCLAAFLGLRAQTVTEIQKITASDRQTTDFFAQSVSIDGDYALVGAPQENHNESGGANKGNAGSVYLYKNNAGTWSQISKLVASDRNNNDLFGSSVAISGDYLVVGATDEDHNEVGAVLRGNAGSAYIFKNDGADNWVQVQKIVASDRANNDRFGTSVAISGDYIVVGSEGESAYVFKNNAGTWSEIKVLTSSDGIAADNFGKSVSISGDYILIGASLEDNDVAGAGYESAAGSAYLFENNSDTWTEVQKIVASDRAKDDNFGHSVAISGSQLVVGAFLEDDDKDGANSLPGAGSVYVFENNAGVWSESGKLVAPDRRGDANFGYSVGVSQNLVAVGAWQHGDLFEGSMYIFEKTGGSWSDGVKKVSSSIGGLFYYGNSIAVSSTMVLTGEYNESTGGPFSGTNEGAAYLYDVEISSCSGTTATIDTVACGSVTINAETYSTNGSFIQLLTNGAGCDSVLTVNVTITTPSSVDLTEEACGGYALNGQTYTSTGLYTQTLVSSSGCDSVINLDLTINEPVNVDLTEEACESFELNGQTYTSTGLYTQTLTGSNGCDSVINIDLTIKQPVNVDLTESACERFELNGQTYNSSGVYIQTLTGVNGCDSIVTLDLTISQPVNVDIVKQSCGSYELNGQTYTTTGLYTQTLTGLNGCDSILNLDLTVNSEINVGLVETACSSYELNGQTYSSTGQYIQTLTSSGGCDSIITLDLTISSSVSVNLTEEACESFELNGQTYTSTGMYVQTLTSSGGCDSIINLDLTINQSVSVIVVQEACESYTLNGETFTSSGDYVQVLTRSNGCDSIVNLSLTINSIDEQLNLSGTTLQAAEVNGTYQWIDCDNGNSTVSGQSGQEFSPTKTGAYSVIVTKGGCLALSECVFVDLMITGSEDQFDTGVVNVFPNPTSNNVSVVFGRSNNADHLINVYTATGVLISSQTATGSQEIVLGDSQGVYMVEVVDLILNTKELTKVIKE